MKKHEHGPVVGVIMANTPSRNICCADKCMKKLMGKSVLSYVVERVSPQVQTLILNANGDPTRFHPVNLPVVPDSVDDQPSTLVAILTAMEWSKEHSPDSLWVATFAADTPFIPENMVSGLLDTIDATNADMAYIRCGDKSHPEFGIWPTELAEDLRYSIEEEKIKRVEKWSGLYETAILDYPSTPVDRFSTSNFVDGILAVQQDRIAL